MSARRDGDGQPGRGLQAIFGGGAAVKAAIGSVVAAAGASACCVGPVVASLVGAGALGATSMGCLEPYRPWLLALTVAFLGVGFVTAYRQPAACADGNCAPGSRGTAKAVLWVAVVLSVLIVGFEDYMQFVF